ncbi:ABC-type spermidine/putrescine transport system, permease component I [Thioflavicoccus mobilis 8321]|uniref:ABC-type spermidine/putrescine transport system, permease component I n=1 Tax=Thioflavicoccus mobilis 8321 TaxID=765912 RepID=L0GUU4_9GAMM|nr:ABC transporter permease subunit [Thioflavicoccus mobilis]AGA89771.1 ABC-type spermidine/putrescine transport system, permease component I [Thioflavicoccus mobilis 8321]
MASPLQHRPRPTGRWSRLLNIGVPYLWLGLFLLLPVAIVAQISLAEPAAAQPPYTALWQWVEDGVLQIRLDFQSYLLLWSDSLYLTAFLNSLQVALACTLLCLLIGYPMAYAIATAPERWRLPLLMLIVLPFWTSFLIRVYAWIGILKTNGLLNNFLLWLGVIDEPLAILYTQTAVYIGIVYSYLPFMILPLYANLTRLDPTLLEAAADLGCRPLRAFLRVTLPLSRAGIIAGSMLVFIPAVGEFVIPDLLGGPKTLMVGRMLWTEFFSNMDWPLAAALALVLLGLLVVPFVLMQRWQQDATEDGP